MSKYYCELCNTALEEEDVEEVEGEIGMKDIHIYCGEEVYTTSDDDDKDEGRNLVRIYFGEEVYTTSQNEEKNSSQIGEENKNSSVPNREDNVWYNHEEEESLTYTGEEEDEEEGNMKENIEKIIKNLIELQQQMEDFKRFNPDNEEIRKAFRNIKRLGIEPTNILEDVRYLNQFIEGFEQIK